MKHNRITLHIAFSANIWYSVIFWIAVLILTGSVSIAYVLRFPWTEPYSPPTEFFIQESTQRPFVYRVLLPLLVEAMRRAVPLDPMVWYGLLMFVSFVGFIAALRRLAQTFWPSSQALDYMALLAIPLMIPLSLEHQHTYDLPQVCLFTWGLVLIVQRRWRALLFCYTIACFNKETTLLLTLVFVTCCDRAALSGHFWRLLAMQLSIYAIIRVALMYLFRDNPGTLIGYNLPLHLLAFELYPVKTLTYMVTLIVAGLLIANRLSEKPLFLRRTLFSILPLMLVLYVVSGYPFEIRIFYEVYAPALLLCVPPALLKLQGSRGSSAAAHRHPRVRALVPRQGATAQRHHGRTATDRHWWE